MAFSRCAGDPQGEKIEIGCAIEVESEYLLKELLQFGWSGEIDT
ncbi:hypothetical protein [Streptomyces drozdowiczii]|nr:hypothetical protein [Streptomyces drozdowiczii]